MEHWMAMNVPIAFQAMEGFGFLPDDFLLAGFLAFLDLEDPCNQKNGVARILDGPTAVPTPTPRRSEWFGVAACRRQESQRFSSLLKQRKR